MAVIVATNVPSIKIQNCLTNATNGMTKSMLRMSTGLKINSAKDDAAGVVISSRMEVQLSGNKICQSNVQNANSMLATTEGNVDVVQDNITRIRDLVLEAKNGTYTGDEKQAIQDEIDQRIEEVDRIASSSKYSETFLFADTNLQKNGLTIQVGPNADTGNSIVASAEIFSKITFTALTGYAAKTDLNVTTATAAQLDTALTKLDSAVTNITDRKSAIGSTENRLESALNSLTTQYENLSSAKSVITDADIAEEASNYTQQQILQQMATSMLAQANSAPSIALSL